MWLVSLSLMVLIYLVMVSLSLCVFEFLFILFLSLLFYFYSLCYCISIIFIIYNHLYGDHRKHIAIASVIGSILLLLVLFSSFQCRVWSSTRSTVSKRSARYQDVHQDVLRTLLIYIDID